MNRWRAVRGTGMGSGYATIDFACLARHTKRRGQMETSLRGSAWDGDTNATSL